MEPAFFISLNDILYLVVDKIFQQPEKKKNDFQGLGQDMTNFNDLKNKLSELPKEILETNFGRRKNLR